jgi:hypothetical protein
MQIESLDRSTRERIYQYHQAMTQAALVQVFDKSETEAAHTVRELWSRYESAPPRERDLLLHNDPVALACDLSGRAWSTVPQEQLKRFNETRRPALERQLGIF